MKKLYSTNTFFYLFFIILFTSFYSFGQTINFDSDGFKTDEDYGSDTYTNGNINIISSSGNHYEHDSEGEGNSSGLNAGYYYSNETFTIETIDGSELDFQSFYHNGYGTAFINKIEGFKNGYSTGTITSGFVDGTNNLTSDFNDVDKIVITSNLGFSSIFDTFVFGTAIVSDTTAPIFENGTPNGSSVTTTGFTLSTDIDEAGTI
ncbi:MAG: hypothetical protein P8L42_03955, partial [Flavicella sp.]|nr:hypothetical protein [Flavicella sp.]